MIMIMIVYVLLLFMIVVVCYSFHYHNHNHLLHISRKKMTSLSLSSSLQYNPFDDENSEMRRLIENEKSTIINDNVSNSAMKNELKRFSRGQGIVDKMTLIEELARLRVKNRITAKQNDDATKSDMEDKAMRLINEINKINNSYSGNTTAYI